MSTPVRLNKVLKELRDNRIAAEELDAEKLKQKKTNDEK